MKKFVAMLTAAVMLMAFVPAMAQESLPMAQESLSMEQALDIAKTVFTIPAERSVFTGTMEKDGTYGAWCLTWETKDDAESFGRTTVYVGMDGIISSYNDYSEKQEQYSDWKTLPSMTRADALDKGVAAIRHILGDVSDRFALDAQHAIYYYANGRYTMEFPHLEHGIPVLSETVRVRLNEAGDLIDYDLSYRSDVTYAAPGQTVMSQEDAAQALGKVSLERFYVPFSDDEAKTMTLRPVYTIQSSRMVDATTGELVKGYAELKKEFANTVEEADAGASGGGAPLRTVEEQAEIDAVSNLIALEDIVARVHAMPEIELDSRMTIQTHRLIVRKPLDRENGVQRYIYRVTERYDEEESYAYCQWSADAQTGELISYYSYGGGKDEPTEAVMTQDEAAATADAFVEAYKAEKRDTYHLRTEEPALQGDERMTRTYTRTIDDVAVRGDQISITVNLMTGKIVRYNESFTDCAVQPIAQWLSENTAAEKAAELLTVSRAYNHEQEKQEDPITSRLVYVYLKTPVPYLDGATGAPLDYSGNLYEETETDDPGTEIVGHYAEAEIRALYEVGIAIAGGVKPDAPITEGDFLQMLSACRGPLRPLDDVYRWLPDMKVVASPENASKPLTREKAVQYTLDCAGYAKVAALSEIYTTMFSDQADFTVSVGYGALAQGLGLIVGENNNFSPRRTMTQAEAFLLLHRFLSKQVA